MKPGEIVSVIITAYNSSSFIIETLESVYNQTWKNIEIIVTDDRSVDDTVEKYRAWIEMHSERFFHSELIISETNTGVAANANRGLKAASGEWIKFIAADDTLLPDCIEQNMKYLETNPQVRILFSKVSIYNESFIPENFIEVTEDDSHDPRSIMYPSRDAFSQYRMLLVSDRIHYTPSAFINRETLLSEGGYDESIKPMEDYPLWLKLTGKGYRLYFMDRVTVNYRRHSKALNNKNENFLVNPNYFKSENFRKQYTYPYLPGFIRLDQRLNWYLSFIFRWPQLNRDTRPNRILHKVIITYLNPFKYYLYFIRRMKKVSTGNELYY